MKTIIRISIVALLLFCFLLANKSYAQQDNAVMTTGNCAMDHSNYTFTSFPVKPPVTGDHFMRILIVYVMFDGETYDPNNSIWPANTTTGPTYKGTMLAQSKYAISDWWNAYNSETQSISSWFCENSRGQTHVIGTEYFVKLNTLSYYMRTCSTAAQRENVINSEIYNSLTSQNVVWSDYDNWSYDFNTGQYIWGFDHNIDMIYKVHRYKYSDLLSEYDASGYAYLGYGSNTTDPWDYQIIQSGQIYHILGGFPSYNYYDRDGSGLTVVGNGTSGVLSKMGAFTRLMHENGHWLFGTGHGNVGIMGDVFDYSYTPFEKVMLGYASPYISSYLNNGYEQVILDDVSGRTSGNYMLRVGLPYGDEYIIASRYKVSPWDRPMLGDTAHGYRTDVNYGQGTYIYHLNGYYHPNSAVDIECADGLWKWVQNGYAAPDWDPNNPWLCALDKTDPVRDANDNGIGTEINSNPDAAKDGLTVLGLANNNKSCSKWFSVGKKEVQLYGDGIDRIFTTETEYWTSREFQVDRWDAWRPLPAPSSINYKPIGNNEVFSPYSCPSTLGWNGQPTGTFIWIYGHDEQTNQTTVKIYRDAVYNSGGMSESAILEATPPSRPVGLKLEYTTCDNYIKHPVIKWKHNTEPDMIYYANGSAYKKYVIYRADDYYNGHIPGNYNVIATTEILASETNPTYIDYTVTLDCDPVAQVPGYQVRYIIKAIDNTNWPSVASDFVATEARDIGGEEGDIAVNNAGITPGSFSLEQNFPNPFNPVTTIKYALPFDSKVSLVIFDVSGRKVKTLVDNIMPSGFHSVTFNGSELSSGIYFYRLSTGNFTQTKRMVLIK